jgi:predicted MFS family arabinose efflux permease
MTAPVLVHDREISLPELLTLLICKLVFNAAFRLVYPLLTFLASGLSVDLRTASLLITAQVGATLLSPLGGMLADTYGERRTMLGGLALFTLGSMVCAVSTSFPPFLAGYILIGLATTIAIPSIQSYASVRSSYAQRGRVLGILELSWALSALIGVSLLTLLAQYSNSWGPAFWAIAVAGIVTMVLVFGMPEQRRTTGAATSGAQATPMLQLLMRRDILAAMFFIFSQLLAVELIFAVYAAWLERDFAASTDQLGLLFGLIGLIELIGSGGAALFTDRIGKRRAVLVGFGLMGIGLALLPFSNGQWGIFLLVFLPFTFIFEFAIVSFFPLISGLAARGRGTVIASSVAMIGLGRMIGSLIAPRLFESYGIGANAWTAAGLTFAAGIAGWFFLREGSE